MARRSTEYDQFVMSGQTTAPQSTTTFGDFSAIIQNNERLANQPEVTPSFSAYSPVVETGSASVPQLASSTPDWAKRTASEQQRVAAAQQIAQQKAQGGYESYADVPTATEETETVPARSETPTGYSQFAPGYAKKEAQIEGEYARSLPNYGAQAERMAQAGIHGGYSDYLQGVAYAKMQDAKEKLRNSYSQFSGVGEGSDTAKQLYANLLSEKGATLAGITDETQYKQWEDEYRSANKGLYSDADVEWTLNNMRNYRQTTLTNAKTNTQDLVKKYGTGEKTSDDVLSAYGLSVVKGKDAYGNDIEETDEEYEARKAESVRWVLSQAVKDKLIEDKELSATVKSKLAIYDADFGNKNWKSKGKDIYNSVSTAIDDNKGKVLSDADLRTVLNDAVAAMGVSTISLDYDVKWDKHPDLELKLGDGTKLKADYNGKASDTVADYLSSKYGNLPLVVYNDELYYQIPNDYEDKTTVESYEAKEAKGVKVNWYKLKTKAGSKGTTEQGDAYFRTVAKIMMYYNNAEKMGKVLGAQNSSNRYRTWDIKTGKLTYSKK